jgi:hypothetical protein
LDGRTCNANRRKSALPLIRLSAPSPRKNGEKFARRCFRQLSMLQFGESRAASDSRPVLTGRDVRQDSEGQRRLSAIGDLHARPSSS